MVSRPILSAVLLVLLDCATVNSSEAHEGSLELRFAYAFLDEQSKSLSVWMILRDSSASPREFCLDEVNFVFSHFEGSPGLSRGGMVFARTSEVSGPCHSGTKVHRIHPTEQYAALVSLPIGGLPSSAGRIALSVRVVDFVDGSILSLTESIPFQNTMSLTTSSTDGAFSGGGKWSFAVDPVFESNRYENGFWIELLNTGHESQVICGPTLEFIARTDSGTTAPIQAWSVDEDESCKTPADSLSTAPQSWLVLPSEKWSTLARIPAKSANTLSTVEDIVAQLCFTETDLTFARRSRTCLVDAFSISK